MLRITFACLALLLFASSADAQRRHRSDFAKEGDLALTIGLAGLDDLALRPLDGGIGLRYRVAPRTVVGASVGVSFTDAEQDSRDDEGVGEDAETDGASTSLSLWAEQHVGGSRVVSPFIGLGGRIRLSRFDSQSTLSFDCVPDVDCSPLTRRAESERVVASGGVLLGAEVRLARGLTLGGAYTLGAEYFESENTFRVEGESQGRSVQSGWRYGVGTTQVALSVYF